MPEDATAVLVRYLTTLRGAVVWKLDGLSEYDVRRPLTPTGTNLLGLVKHLSGVEAGYLGECLGRPVPDLPSWYAEMEEEGSEDNLDMWATADESRQSILDLYSRVTAHADAVVADLDGDASGTVPWWGERGRDVPVHHLLVHVVTETARHAGHMDIVRELVDGTAGLREDVSNLPDKDAASWQAYRDRVQDTADHFR
ncbi:DinB family protein [Knoellia aerolata]|uniref:DinB-like protein, PF04978 family n=1 Tax=Knoellia aerolata DSM 18566 TaxID=1385519 RepID=A0A0A0JQA5_9MICO|nr:DinB family protein [Knoellia aerolata]KGN38904.1 hypothetical protein N801_20000 [Knoellia aerolata DSM 18566]